MAGRQSTAGEREVSGEGVSVDDSVVEPDPDAEYLLFHEVTRLTEFHRLDDNQSLESRVARGRGGASTIGEGDGVCEAELDDDEELMRFSEGQLNPETGFVMYFVPEEYTDLSLYDIVGIPSLPSYPVSDSAFSSLPAWARTELRETGHVKAIGVYDSDTASFTRVQRGWGDHLREPGDLLADLLEEYDGQGLAPPVYRFMEEYGSEALGPAAIAELRGINESTVRDEIDRGGGNN